MALSTNVVHQRLRGATRKLRWSRSVRYTLTGLALGLLLMLVCLLLDSRFHFDSLGRWVSFVLIVVPLTVGGLLTIWAWRPMVSEERIARRIEAKSSLRGNVLINAVQFDRELAAGSPLRRALFEEMQDPFPYVRWSNVFDAELLKKLALILGGVVLGIAVCALIMPRHFANSAARIIMPASDIAPLTRTQIVEISPGDVRIIHGRDLAVSVKLGGEIPASSWIYFREVGSSWQKEAMNREAGLPMFRYTWTGVRQSMDYYVVAGDTRSAIHRATVRPATTISSREASIILPAYTRAGKMRVKDFTILQNVLPGSIVSLGLDFNYPVAELKASDDRAQTVSAQKTAEARWVVTTKVMNNQTLTLNYRDADDMTGSDTLQIAVRGDEPPRIEITAPPEGKELVAARDASIEVRFNCTDNFGLGSVGLYRSTADAEAGQLVQGWKEAVDKKSFSGAAQLALAPFATKGDERLSFCIVAKDQNNVAAPGTTISRPIVVTLKAAAQVKEQKEDQANKLQKGLEDLIKLQRTNLEDTRGVHRMKTIPADSIQPLLGRQTQVSQMAQMLTLSAEVVAPKVRDLLRGLVNDEMKEAVVVLRSAMTAPDAANRVKFLSRAVDVEFSILAKLLGAPEVVQKAVDKGKIEDLLAGIYGLVEKQQKLQNDTKKAAPDAAKSLATRQDALGIEATRVRKELSNAPQTQVKLAEIFKQAAIKFGELKIYEDMLTAAESLDGQQLQPAVATQQRVIVNLKAIIAFLEKGQREQGVENLDTLRAQLEALKAKLDKLEKLQKDVLEKSRDWQRRGENRPEDLAIAEEIKKTKELMEQVLEQMLVDMHIWPDINSYNELRTSVNEIFEDVIQSDKEEIAKGELKPQEIAVQKEDGLLQAIEKAKEIAEDMEMWLPDKSDTTKWLDENFDKREMPEMPLLPLPEALDDIIGNLLKEQQDINQDVQDSASNQALAMAPQGWTIADGPMPGFSAQGKSGSTPPNKNDQNGRSSGGRQGMSEGEMVGDKTQNLQGSDVDTRRSHSKMQKGMIQDPDGPTTAKATDAGGKAGAFSDRMGMEGNAPLRGGNAPRQLAADALAAAQEQLRLKTAKTVTQADMFNLKGAAALADVARLQEQAAWALKHGKLGDYGRLHAQIERRLKEARSGAVSGEILQMPGSDAARVEDKTLLGGNEGAVPTQYKDMVAEYYRSLTEGK